jgi:hypothetical protein
MKILVLLSSFLPKARLQARIELAAAAMLSGAFICPFSAAAGDVNIFDDGTVAIWARQDLIEEVPITLRHNDVLVNDPATPGPDLFDGIEIFDQVPGTTGYPLTWADLIGICYLRATYQKRNGNTGNLGTSVMACPSFRPSGDILQLIPTITAAEVDTGLPAAERIRNTLTANFGIDANVTSVRTYPDPATGRTSASVSVGFNALQSILLDAGQIGNDAFRFVTVSSMFSNSMEFDANLLRWETPDGRVETFHLNNSTPRDAHLLSPGTQLGCWLELVKKSGSTWYPDSPTIRVEISDCENVSQQLGIQGFLDASTDTSDDSFSVWVEWLDVPNPITAGTSSSLNFSVIATAPRALPLASWMMILVEQP